MGSCDFIDGPLSVLSKPRRVGTPHSSVLLPELEPGYLTLSRPRGPAPFQTTPPHTREHFPGRSNLHNWGFSVRLGVTSNLRGH